MVRVNGQMFVHNTISCMAMAEKLHSEGAKVHFIH